MISGTFVTAYVKFDQYLCTISHEICTRLGCTLFMLNMLFVAPGISSTNTLQVTSLVFGYCRIALVPSKYPDSKVQGANTRPIWGRQDPGGPHEPCYFKVAGSGLNVTSPNRNRIHEVRAMSSILMTTGLIWHTCIYENYTKVRQCV